MRTCAVYLRPKGSASGPLHSNQLFGAICWAIHSLFGESDLVSFLESVSRQKSFVVSAAFPCLFGQQNKVRFYPRPLLPEPDSHECESLIELTASAGKKKTDPFWRARALAEIADAVKKIRKGTYVSENLFTEMIQSRTNAAALFRRLSGKGNFNDHLEVFGDGLLTKGERKQVTDASGKEKFWRMTDVQRNGIDRVSGSTVPGILFFSHDLTFQRELAGLWFVLRVEDELIERKIIPAFRLLEDTGFGGDRSIGKGHFTIQLDDQPFQLPQADDPDSVVILSRYLPDVDEFDFAQSPLAYKAVTLRPRNESQHTGSGHRIFKGVIRMLEPGSILPLSKQEKKEVVGRLVEMNENAEIGGWKSKYNGLAIPVYARVGGTQR